MWVAPFLFVSPVSETTPCLFIQIVTVVPVLVTPESRGTVRLGSRDPSQPALYDPNYLDSMADRRIIQWGFHRLRDAMRSDALRSIRVGEYTPGNNVTSSEDVMDAITQSLATIHHVCGTAAMGPKTKGGVVDEKLRVYGTEGLRVVDASLFPTIPTTQIQSAVYAAAEKAADIIKAAP